MSEQAPHFEAPEAERQGFMTRMAESAQLRFATIAAAGAVAIGLAARESEPAQAENRDLANSNIYESAKIGQALQYNVMKQSVFAFSPVGPEEFSANGNKLKLNEEKLLIQNNCNPKKPYDPYYESIGATFSKNGTNWTIDYCNGETRKDNYPYVNPKNVKDFLNRAGRILATQAGVKKRKVGVGEKFKLNMEEKKGIETYSKKSSKSLKNVTVTGNRRDANYSVKVIYYDAN